MSNDDNYAAFLKERLLRSGPLSDVLAAVKLACGENANAQDVLIFDNLSGQQVDFDLRGSIADVLDRLKPAAAKPGRPKLGVESREVTLLPRHWQWLSQQSSGTSATLRRLVEEQMRESKSVSTIKPDAIYKIMSALAGNRPGFEEASRALFAKDRNKFETLIKKWPTDISAHLQLLAESAFSLV